MIIWRNSLRENSEKTIILVPGQGLMQLLTAGYVEDEP